MFQPKEKMCIYQNKFVREDLILFFKKLYINVVIFL